LTSGWFRIDLLAKMFRRLAARLPDAQFEIITREDHRKVLSELHATGQLDNAVESRLTIEAARPSEIHLRLQRHALSLFFYASGEKSELGRSPTRMGEALGCGVPVVTNGGIGDTAAIVRDAEVGLVLDAEDDATLDKAADAATALVGDVAVAARCRATAEAIYSLDSGVAAYRRIYQRLIPSAEALMNGR
jgi:glycosyltransferase involved in cell wall biosynthesis